MYVTHFPCLQCTKQIIQSGITRVIYQEAYRVDMYALELFQRANVTVLKLSDQNEVLGV